MNFTPSPQFKVQSGKLDIGGNVSSDLLPKSYNKDTDHCNYKFLEAEKPVSDFDPIQREKHSDTEKHNINPRLSESQLEGEKPLRKDNVQSVQDFVEQHKMYLTDPDHCKEVKGHEQQVMHDSDMDSELSETCGDEKSTKGRLPHSSRQGRSPHSSRHSSPRDVPNTNQTSRQTTPRELTRPNLSCERKDPKQKVGSRSNDASPPTSPRSSHHSSRKNSPRDRNVSNRSSRKSSPRDGKSSNCSLSRKSSPRDGKSSTHSSRKNSPRDKHIQSFQPVDKREIMVENSSSHQTTSTAGNTVGHSNQPEECLNTDLEPTRCRSPTTKGHIQSVIGQVC